VSIIDKEWKGIDNDKTLYLVYIHTFFNAYKVAQ